MNKVRLLNKAEGKVMQSAGNGAHETKRRSRACDSFVGLGRDASACLLIFSFCILNSAVCLSSSAASQPWATPEDAKLIVQDLQAFFQDAKVRAPGSPGNLAMEEKVAHVFKATGLEHGAIHFTAPVFIPGKTTVTLDGQVPLVIFPMHPTLFRPGNFREKDFSTRLVYLGRGTPADLDKAKGIRLEGALALLDFDCGQDWMTLLRFGLKGFVFIAPERYTKYDALGKINASEVAVPRFLAEAKEGAILKAAALSPATVVRVQAEPSRWENRILRNLWVLIPGRDPDLAREVCVLVAPIDTSGIVPDQAMGAQAGANLFLTMRLLEQFQKAPPKRSVLLTAVNAHTQNFRGERMLAWYLLTDNTKSIRNLLQLTADLHMAQLMLDHYWQLKLDIFRSEDEALLIKWRSLVDNSTKKNVAVKNPLVTLAKRDVNRLKNDQLRLIQKNLPKTEWEAQNQALISQLAGYVHVLTLFNKVGIRTKLSDLTPDEVKILQEYVQEVITANQTILDLTQEELIRDQDNERLREVMQNRSIPFILLLALDWGSPSLAFGTGRGNVQTRWNARWGDNTTRIAAALPAVQSGEHPNRMVDTMTMRGGLPEAYYFSVYPAPADSLRNTAEMYLTAAGHLPVFSLKNTFSSISANVRFLPSDILDRLSPSNLAENTTFASSLLRAVLDDPVITTSSELGAQGSAYQLECLRIKTYKFDELSASVVPDIPVPNCAVIRRPGNPQAIMNPLISDVLADDVITADLSLTDRSAQTIVYMALPNETVSAFHFDKDFTRVDFAVDAGDVYREAGMALFECFELPFYTTADSSLVSEFPIVMDQIMLVTALGNTSPRKYGMTGIASLISKKQINATAGAPAAFYVQIS
ncbi:MAG: hypothetical protein L6455_00490 [Kiritimatiellae bacterium]|nr:hypothetical protein [Verrucomicrobiota bacterium]MBU4289429.1 hypothetical protein [Verrucomicrobiota bacterium]MCG2678441.1 hypothetical protein [Kiritimatiellia bacterium]